ncbi:PREDICTED: E3 ubiquitin-protein ligase RING1-like isoform X2 [Brassica oleracea var. oleracea]|nr:PREDICTED: E3 ubiquitin-protein ligase RING1-like isoform X2 [Brassica oleracea var. oleracea]
MCSQTVNAVMMEDEIKCPFCRSGFVEEMDEDQHSSDRRATTTTSSIWAPILMEMMNNSATRNQTAESVENETGNGRDLDSQLQEILRRRGRRSSVSVVQLLHGVRAFQPESSNRDADDDDNNHPSNGERGRLIVIGPHHQIIAVPRSLVTDSMPDGSSLSDYFIGPGFEALLQRLAENDPNRYGTPPARKEDVESLATVKIQEPSLQCSVCLDDFEVGAEAKQMPCKHNFHADCLLPWLELHSSCPVCRYQLPADDTKTTDSATHDNNGVNESSSATSSSSQGTENSDANRHEGEEENDDGNRNAFSIPWPFSSLFSSSSQGRNSSD